MIKWDFCFLGKSSKELEKLDNPVRMEFARVIEEITNTTDPTTHPKSKSLKHKLSGYFRITVLHKYRMIYTLNKECNTIEIHKIGIRDKFYTE